MQRYFTSNVRFPLETYRELRYQAARRGTTLASLIRESVERYLGRGAREEVIPFGDDPADAHVGSITSGDESVNHDHYLYGWPKEEGPTSSSP